MFDICLRDIRVLLLRGDLTSRVTNSLWRLTLLEGLQLLLFAIGISIGTRQRLLINQGKFFIFCILVCCWFKDYKLSFSTYIYSSVHCYSHLIRYSTCLWIDAGKLWLFYVVNDLATCLLIIWLYAWNHHLWKKKKTCVLSDLCLKEVPLIASSP